MGAYHEGREIALFYDSLDDSEIAKVKSSDPNSTDLILDSRSNLITAKVGQYKIEWYFSDKSIKYAVFLVCLYVDDLCEMGNQVDKSRDRSAFPQEWKQRMVRMSYNRSGQNILFRRSCSCHPNCIKIITAKHLN